MERGMQDATIIAANDMFVKALLGLTVVSGQYYTVNPIACIGILLPFLISGHGTWYPMKRQTQV